MSSKNFFWRDCLSNLSTPLSKLFWGDCWGGCQSDWHGGQGGGGEGGGQGGLAMLMWKR